MILCPISIVVLSKKCLQMKERIKRKVTLWTLLSNFDKIKTWKFINVISNVILATFYSRLRFTYLINMTITNYLSTNITLTLIYPENLDKISVVILYKLKGSVNCDFACWVKCCFALTKRFLWTTSFSN